MSNGSSPLLGHLGFLSPAWPPGHVPNGVVTYTDLATRSLRNRGIRASIFAMDVAPCDDPISRIQDYSPGWWTDQILGRLHRDYYNYDRAWRMIVRAVRDRSRIDPIDSLEMEESFGWAGPVSRDLPLPVVIRLHGPWFLAGAGAGLDRTPESLRRIRREGESLRIVEGVVSPTRLLLDAVRRQYQLPLERAAIIPCSQPLAPESDCWRPSEAVPDSVLFVGRFDRIKGGDVVLEAFRLLLARRPQSRLVFVGPDRGFLDDAGRTWSFKDRLGDVLGSHAERVRWTGELSRPELQPLRRQASLVVVASRSETFPFVALEAMTLGCPLVVSDAGGLPEMVQDGRNGLVFPSGDPAALAVSMERLLADRELAARLGAQGRADVRERYDPDGLAQRTLEYHSDCRARWGHTRGGAV